MAITLGKLIDELGDAGRGFGDYQLTFPMPKFLLSC
jgi:hypothetical protein